MLLNPYRVLDLTDHRGEINGMVLADLGAEVIRIEPPGGSPARRCQPLLQDAPEPDRSLQFAAYNRGKRSIVLDLHSVADRAVFLDLVATADFVMDSGVPGSLESFNLGFDVLRRRNPRIVHVLHTPFGVDGPRAQWLESDLVLAAMGGSAAIQGVPDRPPIRVSVPQVWRHAGAEGAVAALVAHARMRRTGEAQFVDVSAQCAITWTLLNAMTAHAIQGSEFARRGSMLLLGGVTLPLVYLCKDGFIIVIPSGKSMAKVMPWMIDDGVVDAGWGKEDWSTFDLRLQTGQPVLHTLDQLVEAFQRWMMRYNKLELMERGLRSDVSFAPVNNMQELLEFKHLHDRGFWAALTLPDGTRALSPGRFAHPAKTPLRDPMLGLHLNEHGSAIRQNISNDFAKGKEVVVADHAEFPFSGLKIADFSWVGVGPITARYLADHGATVVRIESEARPDVLRLNGPFKDMVPGLNRSQFYGDFNTSKLGLQLDLKNPAALEIARRLIAWADVCIESFTPGTMKLFGLDYDNAREINPSIVMLSTCLMGQTGPAAAFAGYGYHAGAVAGFYEITGWPDLRPDGPWIAYTDTIAPRYAAATLMAALDHRRRTGEGQFIDLAQIEAGLQFLTPEILEYQRTGEQVTRIGNRSRYHAPQGNYPCQGEDRFCAIAIDTDEQWLGLCKVMGRADWAADTSLATASGRMQRHDELDTGISSWTHTLEPLEVAELLQAAGVPAGPAQKSGDLLNDPQYRHRGFYRWLDHAEMGHIPYAGHQFRIRGYDSGPRSPAPLLGEHLMEVLQGILGMDDEEIANALSDGILG